MSPSDLVKRTIDYWGSKRPDLSFCYEPSYISYKHSFKVLNKKAQCGYQFEIEQGHDEFSFETALYHNFSKAIRHIDKAIQDKSVTFDNFNPFQLTMQEEEALAEELRKVKEGFYANIRRNKYGNRISKEELEKYKTVEGFGDF